MEELATKAAFSIAEKSVLGSLLIIAIISLAALIIYLLKQKNKDEEDAIRGMQAVLTSIQSFLEAQKDRDEIFITTIVHERGRSKECFGEIVKRLDDIGHKLDLMKGYK